MHKADESSRRIGVFSREDGKSETNEELAKCKIIEVAYKSSKALVLCVSSARRDCRPDRQTKKNSFTIVSFLNNREDSIFFTTFQ